MRATERRPIDWAERAPLVVQATATSAAPPDAVFAVLADHERWPEWFPNVRKVVVTGAASGVGATRRVHIPGAAVDEVFIAWEPGVRWAFTGTAAKPGFLTSIVEDCRLEPVEGGTAISYTMYLEPSPRFRPLVKLMSRFVRAGIQKGVDRLAERATR